MPPATVLRQVFVAALAVMLLLRGSPAAASDPAVRATWIGGATLHIQFGPLTIVTDPVLGEGAAAFTMFDPNSGRDRAAHARLSTLPPLPPGLVDLVLVSHDHSDHLDDAALASFAAGPAFLVPASQARKLRERKVQRVEGLDWGQTHRLERDGYSVEITALPALHSAAPDAAAKLGTVNGYWLEFRRDRFHKSIYWTGDSFPEAASLAAGFRRPDLLVVHLGAVGGGGPFGRVSMNAAEAVEFARVVQPTAVLPIHHSTFSLYREPISQFVAAAHGQPWRLDLIGEGSELTLTAPDTLGKSQQ